MGEHTKEQLCWLLFIFTYCTGLLAFMAHRTLILAVVYRNPVPNQDEIKLPDWCMPPWITREVSTQCIQDRSKAQSKRRGTDALTQVRSAHGAVWITLHWGPCCFSG